MSFLYVLCVILVFEAPLIALHSPKHNDRYSLTISLFFFLFLSLPRFVCSGQGGGVCQASTHAYKRNQSTTREVGLNGPFFFAFVHFDERKVYSCSDFRLPYHPSLLYIQLFYPALFIVLFSFISIRVEQLEKQQSENLERFKVRTKELKTSVSKELQEATLDAAGKQTNRQTGIFCFSVWNALLLSINSFMQCFSTIRITICCTTCFLSHNLFFHKTLHPFHLSFLFHSSILRPASADPDQEQGASTDEKSRSDHSGPAHRNRTILSRSSARGKQKYVFFEA